MHNYYVYILCNKAKTVLYVGMADNLAEKLYYHENPEAGSKAFTAKYSCHYLVYWEHFTDVDDALDREIELKGLQQDKKEALISGYNPEWKFLNGEIG